MRRHWWLIGAGVLLLGYALLGNYVALPGYVRFLERGGTSAAGNALDAAVIIGATKTILWMYSFQLGVLCFACAWAAQRRLPVRGLVVGVLAWLTLWSWPSLPAPGAWFYVTFGTLLLVAISSVLLAPKRPADDQRSTLTFVAALLFFAFATWEVCGLGSTGRILRPDEARSVIAHNLVVTQSSKLMIEFVLAWGLMLGALRRRSGGKPA